MSVTTTPAQIDDKIREFAKLISFNSSNELQYIDVNPTKGAKPGYCYFNVRDKVLTDGGSIQYGWIIWKWDNLMLEAEFHSVWKDKDGKLIDITPTFDGEKQVLFLPDYVRKFEGKVIDNFRLPLIKNEKLDTYIEIASRITNIRNKIVDNTTSAMYTKELGELTKQKNDLYIELIHLFDNVGRNDKCPCGSGNKYKRCCGNK